MKLSCWYIIIVLRHGMTFFQLAILSAHKRKFYSYFEQVYSISCTALFHSFVFKELIGALKMSAKHATRTKVGERKHYALRTREDNTFPSAGYTIIEHYTELKDCYEVSGKTSPSNYCGEKRKLRPKFPDTNELKNLEDQKFEKKTKTENTPDETLADTNKPENVNVNPSRHYFSENLSQNINDVDPVVFTALRHALKCSASSSDQCIVNKCKVAKNFLFRGLIHANLCKEKCDFLLCKDMKSVLLHMRSCENNNFACKTKQFVVKLCEYHQNTCVNQPCDIELCKDKNFVSSEKVFGFCYLKIILFKLKSYFVFGILN